MGGKSSAPAAPDYSQIAAADEQQGNQEYALGEQQLQWGQQQFNTIWPYASNYLNTENAATAQEEYSAAQQQQTYNQYYLPLEQKFAGQASTWDSPARASANAGAAEADVANTFDASRQASLQSLESYGIDPSQTRYSALDLGTRVNQAAATAAAGTQSNLNTQATGLALEGEAINVGRGYSNSIAQSYNTATNAGSSGIGSANQTVNTGVNAMGSPTSYMNLANGSNANATSALNTGFQNQMAGPELQMQQSANTMSGIGSLIGGGIMAAALI